MQRLNPDTNLPYKKGEICSETRNVFLKYKKERGSTGFYRESWATPDVYRRMHSKGKKAGNKRNNPITNRPFVYGDQREDGFYFRQYDQSKVKKDGLYVEVWESESAHKKNRRSRADWTKKANEKLKRRGDLKLKKRRSPETGKIFVKGDHIDGKFFIKYELRDYNISYEGCYREVWTTKEGWETYKQNERTPRRLATVLCNHARARSRKHNSKFNLDPDIIAHKIEKGICEATGIKFVLELDGPKSSRQPFSPSLDRIDNDNRNYTHDNVRVVISAFNNLRSELDEETLDIVINGYLHYRRSNN